ncbi:hypothetical protein GCM10007418_15820 [Halopseudomonas salina]|uniref:Uncharacterized protein n=1 Tax=Halopseudomonas salina TaxID=1323744 RepID=A0ABQ1PH66_9GAMM|nr:hypothetical protein GCM10007418_15820 [Halopseudomonas salina]
MKAVAAPSIEIPHINQPHKIVAVATSDIAPFSSMLAATGRLSPFKNPERTKHNVSGGVDNAMALITSPTPPKDDSFSI